MLTQYENVVCNVEERGNQINLWRYSPAKGFNQGITKRGIVYYERNVNKDEVGAFFSIEFVASYENQEMHIISINDEYISVICDDVQYAKHQGFMEIEHGVWQGQLPLENVQKIVMLKHFEDGMTETTSLNTIVEFQEKWNKYVKEVSI